MSAATRSMAVLVLAAVVVVGLAGCSFLADLSSGGGVRTAASGGASGSASAPGSAVDDVRLSPVTVPSGGPGSGDGSAGADATRSDGTASAVDEIALEPTGPSTGSSQGSAAPDCSATASWTTADKERAPEGDVGPGAPIRGVTAASTGCFERLTVEMGPAGQAVGYRVRYVPQVLADGSGQPVPLRGAAFLEVVIYAPAYDPATGEPTVRWGDASEIVDASELSVIRQVAYAGSFEGQTTFGVGVDGSPQPFGVSSGLDADGHALLTIDIGFA